MNSPEHEILIVADTDMAAGPLAAVVRERANAGRCHLTLLIPAVAHGLHRVVDPEDQCCAEAEQTIHRLRPRLEAAVGGPLRILIGSHDPMAAIQDALNAQEFEQVILATRSSRPARWARLDLTSKAKALGVPVTAVRVTPKPLEAA
jgi:hypothetical protein